VKKYLALLLITIMAVSVLSAAGAVTAQKAATQPISVQKAVVQPISAPIDLLYSPGATYRYTPAQFNQQWYWWTVINSATASAAASGGTASASISTTTTGAPIPVGQAGESWAAVGMGWQQPTLPSTGQYSTWAAVKNMPCTVTVTAYYVIQARGNQNTYANAYWGPWLQGSPYRQDSVVAGYTGQIKAWITTTTWHGTVGAFFSGGSGFAGVAVDSGQPSGGPGQASGNIVCTSIVLAFPK
jgi:hypothetical protein